MTLAPFASATPFASLTRTTPARNLQLRPVPQELVHKLDRSEVLLTGWAPAGEDRVTVTAQWPRTHAFYAPAAGNHDPMLLAESLRQCLPLISHAVYDVPFGHHLIWQHFSFEIDPDSMGVGGGPTDLQLRITCSDITRRGGRLAALTMDVDVLRDDWPVATAHTRFSCNSPAIYRRLRGEHYTEPGSAFPVPSGASAPVVVPVLVDREQPGDVVLSPTAVPDQWQLRVDASHPVLFDHPVDHAPGMLLLEAARQAAHALHGPFAGEVTPVRFDSAFFRYVEFDSPCLITARVEPAGSTPEGTRCVSVTAIQEDATAFTCRVTMAERTGARHLRH
ncbi:ScbA/BarX family gamma-butyrolactone biosynthesis protein [Streptomyces sp. NPDC048718]|uniref:ScbA/BarX family gamma-butyrolactone biosynthesis protein n=1 Tax=Streptomyces sp. NPDC048718 TaxID=3365587 RepID=UPI003710A8FE